MRGDLRRQIEWLERDFQHLSSVACPWEARETNHLRGPGLMGAADLERIRDELLEGVRELRARVAGEIPPDELLDAPPSPRACRWRGLLRLLSRRDAKKPA